MALDGVPLMRNNDTVMERAEQDQNALTYWQI